MRPHRSVVGVVLVALFVAGMLTAPARGGTGGYGHTGTTSTETLRMWNEVAVATLVGLPPTAGGAPSASPIHVAMVQGAVYDAVNAIGPRRRQPYLLTKRFPWWASRDAAVATAAHAVLADIVSTAPGIEASARATLLESLGTRYDESLAGIRDGWSKRKGVAAGSAAATAMIAARRDDGRFGPSPWVANRAPGHWWPLDDPLTGQPLLDPTPWVGDVEPFLLETSSQLRTRGPRDLRSAAWAREFNEVKALGEADSTVRTEEQTYIARWWQSQPIASWNSVARQLIAGEGLGVARAARLLAMQNLSTADASISCWNDKYHWDFWRPWNAIPRARSDGNPATEPQADWTSLITAPYPEHPSGHLCSDGGSVGVLRMFFGDRVAHGFDITSASAVLQPTDERTRHFTRFSRVLAEIVEARIWAGLHYRTADRQGKALGLKVARHAADHYFRPVGHGW
jgi:hypothetical protein